LTRRAQAACVPIEERREIAIALIMRETKCTEKHAISTLKTFRRIVKQIRSQGYTEYRMTEGQRTAPQYNTLSMVMKHGRAPKKGSAHEAIEWAELDPDLGELGLRHNVSGGQHWRRCWLTCCTIEITVGVIR
jgi:hypothetical protein